MAKIRYTEGEARIALLSLIKELGVDNHRHFGFPSLLVAGPGRIYLKAWSRQDEVDADVVYRGTFPFFVNGLRDGMATADLELKWFQRASFYVEQNREQLAHVVDWLDASAVNVLPWTMNVDERGRPKKLLKCGSLAALVAEADKQMSHQLRIVPKGRALLEGAEEVVVELEGHFSIVRLLTAEALDAESNAMHHCIGLGSYDQLLDLPGYEFFSVRDADNRPIATLEVLDGKIEQFRGKFNAVPSNDAVQLVQSLRAHLGWITRDEYAIYLRIVQNQESHLSAAELERIGTVVDRGRMTRHWRDAEIATRDMVSIGQAFEHLTPGFYRRNIGS